LHLRSKRSSRLDSRIRGNDGRREISGYDFPRVAGFGSVRRGREACHDHGRTIATGAGGPCRA